MPIGDHGPASTASVCPTLGEPEIVGIGAFNTIGTDVDFVTVEDPLLLALMTQLIELAFLTIEEVTPRG